MKHLALLLLILCLAPAFAHAQAAQNLSYKTSLDFLDEDGAYTEESMKAEADYIYRACQSNPYQKNYYSCECIGGAFLIEREKRGPAPSHHVIMKDIMQSGSPSCADTPTVAGNAFSSCLIGASAVREMTHDIPEYCTCVANKVAIDFTKKPIMSPSYTRMLQIGAMAYCEIPSNRTAQKKADTAIPKTMN